MPQCDRFRDFGSAQWAHVSEGNNHSIPQNKNKCWAGVGTHHGSGYNINSLSMLGLCTFAWLVWVFIERWSCDHALKVPGPAAEDAHGDN
ncbi:hypothetical protein BDV10DRAFT_160871 [Aspergillus recurvatus]